MPFDSQRFSPLNLCISPSTTYSCPLGYCEVFNPVQLSEIVASTELLRPLLVQLHLHEALVIDEMNDALPTWCCIKILLADMGLFGSTGFGS